MWEYLRLHETFVRRALAGDYGSISLAELERFHGRQLQRMQQERLVHLLVTMFVSTFLLLVIGFLAVKWSWPAFALAGLLLLLATAYYVHYFRLENGIQRCYHLANRIEAGQGRVCACYEAGKLVPRPGRGAEPVAE